MESTRNYFNCNADDVHNVDINNILSGYHPLAMDAQLDLQHCSDYNSMVRGGDYV
jgi:hypothetical protein